MRRLVLLFLLSGVPALAQPVLTEGTNIAADVSGADGRIAMDLLGSIWLVAEDGGDAKRINNGTLPARSPRWSPDGRHLVYQTYSPQQSQVWKLDVSSGETELLTDRQYFDRQPDWHPDGSRIVFSSERGADGFDLWELDLASKLSWRISNLPGDEVDPAWSANGRHLAFVHRQTDRWSLMLRRFGQPDEVLFHSVTPLHAPSWRPDGSLLTFLQQTPDGLITQMVILSDPPIVRPLMTGEDFFIAPVSWFDRHRYYYTADGGIKTRDFDARRPERVHFAAHIDTRDPATRLPDEQHRLKVSTPSDQRQILRTARLFDGDAYDYRYAIDVEIADGRVVSVEPRRDWPDAIILDLGDVTLLPGFIDAYASLSGDDPARVGAELLSYGVTTIVTPDRPDLDPLVWETADRPGPRLLRARPAMVEPQQPESASVVLAILPAAGHGDLEAVNIWKSLGIPVLAESWTSGLGLGADLLMGADSLPTSPRGVRYQDIQIMQGFGPITLLSGLADATTPGLAELLASRQAVQLGRRSPALRRHGIGPELSGRTSPVVLGSRPSGLPAGLALHAEFRALEAAGLSGDQVLKSAGIHAAAALRLGGQVGIIVPGALADFVLVSGDPLHQAADTLNIAAVVRNGRFFSLSSLLERATPGSSVE